MSSILFDTHEAVKRLVSTGLTEEQASEVVKVCIEEIRKKLTINEEKSLSEIEQGLYSLKMQTISFIEQLALGKQGQHDLEKRFMSFETKLNIVLVLSSIIVGSLIFSGEYSLF